jgi:hypothetical protein
MAPGQTGNQSADPDDNPIRTMASAQGLDNAQRDLILGGNAARFFGLPKRPAKH